MKVVKGRDLGDIKKETINDLFWNTVEKFPEITAVRYRGDEDFKSLTYSEIGDMVKNLGQALISLGITKGDKVSLLSETRYEWTVVDFAILTAAGVTVTVYPTLSERTIQYIVDNSDSKIIIVENREQLDKVLSIKDQLPKLEHIIVIEDPGKINGEKILTLEEAFEVGRRYGSDNPGCL